MGNLGTIIIFRQNRVKLGGTVSTCCKQADMSPLYGEAVREAVNEAVEHDSLHSCTDACISVI